jgi:hypothetical protein
MPIWVLLVEYLPLFTLLTTGYIFRKYISHNVFSGFIYPQKIEKLAKVTK